MYYHFLCLFRKGEYPGLCITSFLSPVSADYQGHLLFGLQVEHEGFAPGSPCSCWRYTCRMNPTTESPAPHFSPASGRAEPSTAENTKAITITGRTSFAITAAMTLVRLSLRL